MKKVLFPVMTAAVSIALASFALAPNKANAFGDYASHEHPFHFLGSGWDQYQGDAYCRQVFADKGGYQAAGGAGGGWGWNDGDGWFGGGGGGFSFGGNLVYAHDGTIINGANHVWYHQRRGECIANK
jgi:hypothetical protein